MKRMLLSVGNRLSHDDGVGPVVAEGLVDSDWIAIDCGTALENAAGIVSREQPDLLVIVDAAIMGKEPGDFLRLPIGANDRMLASTHGLPLSFVLGNIESATKETVLIGIEPADLSFGEGLSPAVDTSVRVLIEHLRHATIWT
ncbi:hydrogenase 3 maturation endopeptidase HyCI [Candidatus Bipolaricaulota bacterium]|nr:hydrogenase 3 maturation endopeptidase HyCI [Candidatus Bipolaricaulota bacterium]